MPTKSEITRAVAAGASRFYEGGDRTPDPALSAEKADDREGTILHAWFHGWDMASQAANGWQS